MTSATNLLTTEQVAARLGKSPSTVARYATTGRLPAALKMPGRNGNYLFESSVVLAYLDGDSDAEAS